MLRNDPAGLEFQRNCSAGLKRAVSRTCGRQRVMFTFKTLISRKISVSVKILVVSNLLEIRFYRRGLKNSALPAIIKKTVFDFKKLPSQ